MPFANAELVAVPISNAIPLPADISFKTASSVLLQGLTAHYLATDSHKTKKDEIIIIHASAGGVGQLLTQIIKGMEAKVIGLTSSKEKAIKSFEAGADKVFLYSENWKQKVFNIYPAGVDVVYDSIGNTLMDSLEVTKICGQVVFYGMAGGNPELVDPRILMDTSKTLTGGDLWNYITSKEERIKRADQLFKWLRNKDILLGKPTVFKLQEGKKAHEFLESRKSTGKIILVP